MSSDAAAALPEEPRAGFRVAKAFVFGDSRYDAGDVFVPPADWHHRKVMAMLNARKIYPEIVVVPSHEGAAPRRPRLRVVPR